MEITVVVEAIAVVEMKVVVKMIIMEGKTLASVAVKSMTAAAKEKVDVSEMKAAVKAGAKAYVRTSAAKSARRFVKTVMTDGREALTTDGLVAVMTDGMDAMTEEITDGPMAEMIPVAAMIKQSKKR